MKCWCDQCNGIVTPPGLPQTGLSRKHYAMNPQDPASFRTRTEKLTTGRTYHFVDERPESYTKGAMHSVALDPYPSS